MRFPQFTNIPTSNKLFLTVRIKAPSQVIFAGEATSVSSKNSKGNFDILPNHANFITLIEKEPIIIRTRDNQQQTFTFPLAIVYSNNNQVAIYTDISIKGMLTPK